MRIIGLVLFGWVVAASAAAQGVVRFPASQMQDVARSFAGSEQNWPIVASVAGYLPEENQYELSAAAQAELRRFLALWNTVTTQRADYLTQLRSGAKVFAATESQRTDTLSVWFQRQIQAGSLPNALQTGESLVAAMRSVSEAVARNRRVDVEARLAEKTGTVDRREGLLGAWNPASVGNQFKQSDGVRTAAKSLAKLNFVDGSDVIVNENSVAVIRNSRIDRLTNETDVEITVSSGGLLARLSTTAVQRSTYQVNVEAASTTLRSQNFYAERTEDRRVVLSNFNGEATVTAESRSVTLAENQGTIVVRGRAPLPPIELLAAPRLRWAGTDTVVYGSDIRLDWASVNGAVRYEVDVSPTARFDRALTQLDTRETRLTLPELGAGTAFVRVRAYDAQGLRGVDSPTYRILRNEDLVPPPLFLRDGNHGALHTPDDTFRLIGETEPGSRLTANGRVVDVAADGTFDTPVPVAGERMDLELVAIDRSGNRTQETRTIVRMTPERLFALRWERGGRAGSRRISGNAYEPLDVHITVNGRTTVVPCGIDGQWSFEFEPGEATSLHVRFHHKRTSAVIAERLIPLE